MAIVADERATYEEIWAIGGYADNSPGASLAPLFAEMAHQISADQAKRWTDVLRIGSHVTVLDAGCGSGKGAVALRALGFAVTLCDLTPAGLVPEAADLPFHQVALWDDVARTTGKHDYCYCCDVMEHIPPVFAMLVVDRLLQVAKRGVFFSISLVPDQCGALVGKSLHQTVQSFTAWRDQLDTVGEVVEARDLLVNAVYFVRAR